MLPASVIVVSEYAYGVSYKKDLLIRDGRQTSLKQFSNLFMLYVSHIRILTYIHYEKQLHQSFETKLSITHFTPSKTSGTPEKPKSTRLNQKVQTHYCIKTSKLNKIMKV